jgi:hypothetical protein
MEVTDRKNRLAYCGEDLITAVKGFIVKALVVLSLQVD